MNKLNTEYNHDYVDYMKYQKSKSLPSDFIVIDFETTGLSHKSCEIIQMAAIKYIESKESERFVTLVQPFRSISSKITRLTGITNEAVATAPLIDEVLPDFVQFLENHVIIAHNASFDMKFLLHNAYYLGLDKPNNHVIDTVYLARKHMKDVRNHKLETLKTALGLSNMISHRADTDCMVTAEVYKKCRDHHMAGIK
ncbi:3'-5' exonuclease [Terrilactibacillus laevilacticus]|uniref:3'-5' exonuclease n=1 Tax=Terrilactibacillus laevilacticus TaxID=1380157 RepID=UPI0011476003|nr:exonuclease domain-containing protein [Terrilactibacillus laevilacticus]